MVTGTQGGTKPPQEEQLPAKVEKLSINGEDTVQDTFDTVLSLSSKHLGTDIVSQRNESFVFQR